jgi:hypothetical protein
MFGTALVVTLGAWTWSLGEALEMMRSHPTVSDNASAVTTGGAAKPVISATAAPARTVPDVRLRTAVAPSLNRAKDAARGSARLTAPRGRLPGGAGA